MGYNDTKRHSATLSSTLIIKEPTYDGFSTWVSGLSGGVRMAV